MNYEGRVLKSARVYSNDPGGTAVFSLRAFVAAPIFISPRYVSFYGFEKEDPSVVVHIEAGLEKALNLEAGDFSLEGRVTYTIQEVEKGRTFKIMFQALPCSAGIFRGYLNLKTNYPEKPLLNIKIIGRFVKDEKNETG
jgi:hypothetical protein